MTKKIILILLTIVFLLLIPRLSVTATTTQENNSFWKAEKINVNDKYSSKLSSVSDIDYYYFEISNHGYIEINLNCIIDGGASEFKVCLYDEYENMVDYAMYFPTVTSISSSSKIGLKPGIYYITFESYFYKYTNQYYFQINYTKDSFIETENNNTFQSANSIKLNTDYDGRTTNTSDIDYYKFYVNYRSEIEINFFVEEGNNNTYKEFEIYLYDNYQSKVGGPIYFKELSSVQKSTIFSLDSGYYYLSIETKTFSYVSYLMYTFSIYQIHTCSGNFTITKNPTCTSTGTAVKYCSICEKFLESKTLSKTSHSNGEWVIDSNSTCTTNGKKHATCSVCNYITYETITAPGHKFTEWTVDKDATCEEDGLEKRECANCDYFETKVINKLGHSFGEWKIVDDPTCTKEGLEKRECLNCDHYVTKTLNKLSHSYNQKVTTTIYLKTQASCLESAKYYFSCICGDKGTESFSDGNPLGHNYNDIIINPTCTEQGYTTHTCLRCNDSYIDSYINAKGHAFGEWKIVEDATCIKEGLEKRECSNCDHYETKTLNKLLHSYNQKVTTNLYIKEVATCLESAKYFYSCVCGDKGTELFTEGTPLGHDYSNSITNPTCTKQGYTTHTCLRCSDSYIDSYVDARGHSYEEWKEVINPTCTTDGSSKRECLNCDHSESKIIELLGHNYNNMIIEPTCTEQGYTTHICSRCNDSYKNNYINAKGHSYGDWKIVKPATEDEEGTKQRECSICKHIDTQVIPTLNHTHNYSSKVIEATCTKEGYTEHTCRCGDTYKDTYTKVKEHSYRDWTIETSATCTSTGLNKRLCENCNHFETKKIDKLPHTFNQENILNEYLKSEASCDQASYYYYSCICGEKGVESFAYGESLGHNYNTTWCNDNESHWKQCITCNHRQDVEIHQPGPEATETSNQVCLICDYILKESLSHKHSYSNNWENDSTHHWYKCECGEINNKNIHQFKEEILTEATKENDGIKKYTCTDCGYSYEEAIKYKESLPNNNFVPIVVCSGVAGTSVLGIVIYLIRRKKKFI